MQADKSGLCAQAARVSHALASTALMAATLTKALMLGLDARGVMKKSP
jgi:hypothetical protein